MNRSKGHVDSEDRIMRKLFLDQVGSLSESDIRAEFEKYGPIEEVARIQDRRNNQRAFAFVVFNDANGCLAATKEMFPVIKGQRCKCMLAALGQPFSGHDFFAQKGILTDNKKGGSQNKTRKRRRNKKNVRNGHSNSHSNVQQNGNSVHSNLQQQQQLRQQSVNNGQNGQHHLAKPRQQYLSQNMASNMAMTQQNMSLYQQQAANAQLFHNVSSESRSSLRSNTNISSPEPIPAFGQPGVNSLSYLSNSSNDTNFSSAPPQLAQQQMANGQMSQSNNSWANGVTLQRAQTAQPQTMSLSHIQFRQQQLQQQQLAQQQQLRYQQFQQQLKQMQMHQAQQAQQQHQIQMMHQQNQLQAQNVNYRPQVTPMQPTGYNMNTTMGTMAGVVSPVSPISPVPVRPQTANTMGNMGNMMHTALGMVQQQQQGRGSEQQQQHGMPQWQQLAQNTNYMGGAPTAMNINTANINMNVMQAVQTMSPTNMIIQSPTSLRSPTNNMRSVSSPGVHTGATMQSVQPHRSHNQVNQQQLHQEQMQQSQYTPPERTERTSLPSPREQLNIAAQCATTNLLRQVHVKPDVPTIVETRSCQFYPLDRKIEHTVSGPYGASTDDPYRPSYANHPSFDSAEGSEPSPPTLRYAQTYHCAPRRGGDRSRSVRSSPSGPPSVERVDILSPPAERSESFAYELSMDSPEMTRELPETPALHQYAQTAQAPRPERDDETVPKLQFTSHSASALMLEHIEAPDLLPGDFKPGDFAPSPEPPMMVNAVTEPAMRPKMRMARTEPVPGLRQNPLKRVEGNSCSPPVSSFQQLTLEEAKAVPDETLNAGFTMIDEDDLYGDDDDEEEDGDDGMMYFGDCGKEEADSNHSETDLPAMGWS